MKYAREVKVGVLAVVCAGILYFGFNFLKGVNIFSPTDCYYGQFERSNGLTEQAPVYILGHQVGLVESIYYDFTRVPAFTVGVSINDDITLPIGTNMALVADGLLGGAAIELILPEDTGVAYKGGDTLTTTIVPGLMESLQAGVLANLDSLLAETNVLISNLTSEMEMGSLNATLRNIEQITSDLKVSGKDIRQFTHGQLRHQVGLVESINYDFTRVPAFTVGVSINDDITLPIGTNMALVADGLLGGAAIELILPEDTGVAYKGGDTLTTTIVPGLMESLQAGVLANLDSLLAETNVLISNLTSEMEMGSLNATLRNIEQITSDLKVSGKDIRQFTHGQLPSIIARIDTTIAELQVIVTNVKDANVQNTVEDLNETIRLLNELLQSEDGTLGLLLNDTELHDNLNAALKNLDKAVLNVDSVVMSIKEQPFIKKRIPKN